MNNFSGYQGLPNLSTIVADDLDISNLIVDTITVNTELKTNSIQPLTSNDDIDIGLGTNTGVINLNQDTVATNLEVSNILTTDNIQPSTNTSNIVIGTNTNTGIIDIQQDTEVDNLQVNVELKTENIQPINGANDILIGTNGNTGQIIHYQNTAIYDGLGVSTTYPVSTYNAQIIANGVSVPAKIKLVNETSGEGCYVELNRGDYDFGADADRDWRILNDLNGYFYLQSGQSAVIKDYITAGDDEFHITNTLGAFVDNTTLSIGTTDRTRRLNVSNKQDTTQSNYILLQNDNYTNRENGIQIQNSNAGVLNHNWYLVTRANSSDFLFNYNGGVNDRFIFTNAGVLKLTTLTGTTTSTAFSLGESGDSAGITSNRSMTFASGKVINMPSNGPIYTLFVRNNPTTSAIQLYDTTTTGSCNFMTSSTTASLNILNGTTSGACNIFSNLFVGTNAVQKGVVCAYYQAYDPTNLVRLFATSTTGNIRIGEALTTGSLLLHNTGGSGSITLNANTVLATGKSLTFSTTSDLKVNSIQPINVGDTTNFMTTSTAQINIGNPASVSALAISNTISMASAKNIYLPNTNQRIECNNFESFTNSNPVEMYRLLTGTFTLGNSANTNKLTFKQDLLMDGKAIYCDGITATASNVPIYIGQDTDTSFVEFDRNVFIYVGKILYSDTQRATSGITANVSLYDNTTTGIITCGASLSSGDLTLHNSSATTGRIKLQADTQMPSTKTLYLNFIDHNSTTGSTAELYSGLQSGRVKIGKNMTSGFIELHNTSATTGQVICNSNMKINTTKNLYCNSVSPETSSESLALGGTILTGDVAILGNQSTGNLYIGSTTGTGKTIFNNSTIQSAGNIVNLFNNNTTTAVNLATGLTTANLSLAGAQTTGRVIIGNQSATPSAGNGHITAYNRIHNSFSNGAFMFNVNSGTNLFNLTTTGALGGKQLTNTMYASAPTDNFNCIEGNSGSEGCAWLMNGDTSIIVNPGDQSSLWYLDEDSFTTANNWAWTGYKISTTGVITASSDRRIKRDITPIVKENLLETLSKVQFVNYKKKAPTEEKYYKNGEFRRKYKEVHMGVIAQDVRQAGLQEVCEKENEDAFWTVKYQDLGLYFNMGVKELIKENIALKERVSKLENFLKTKFEDFV